MDKSATALKSFRNGGKGMDSILQAYIGALPILIGIVVYLFKKKKLFIPAMFFAVQILFSTFMIALNAPEPISELEVIDVYESYKEMGEGNYSEALSIINDAFMDAADRVEITLAKARLYALQGSWEEAVTLYEKVIDERSALVKGAEMALVEDIKNGVMLTAKELSFQSANIHYLKSQGVNPVDFGLMALTDEQIEANVAYLDNVQKSVVPGIVKEQLTQMEEEYTILTDIGDIDKVVDHVMSNDYNTFKGVPIVEEETEEESDNNADNWYDDMGNNQDNPPAVQLTKEEICKQLNEKLVEYKEKYPQLFEESKYMEAYIFSEILAGNKLDDVLLEGGSDAYDIISNMYMSGIITEENFSKDFSEEYKSVYKDVLEQCQEVAKDIAKKQDIEKVYVDGQSIVDVLNELTEQDNFALQQISKDMDNLVEDGEVDNDKLSEILITMSTIANAIGDDEKAKDLFNEAVNHSSESGAKEFAQIMGTIADAYEDGGEDIDYIEVSEKVAQVYDDKFHYDIVSDEIKEDVKGVAGSAVSETIARVSIGKIDATKFPNISASVQYAGDTPLDKDIITLKDCNIEIEDFTVEKRQYDGSKVILLCDVSGSMRGSIEQLKDAVIRYVRTMEEGEQVNIVLFSDAIDATSGFLTDKEELTTFAQNEVYVRGGTQISESTNTCLSHFADDNIANTLIVMTDGEDNRPYSDADIKSRIGGLAEKNNVTVYTIGLGSSVDSDFLTKLATAGGGKFLYCSDESVLESAYKFIHERINNEYIIKFGAEDLDSLTRLLEIKVDDGNMKTPANDSKEYTIQGDATEEDTNVQFDTKLPEGVKIKGLDVTQVEKSTERQLIKILGSGFADVKVTNVYLQSTKGQSNCKIKEVKDGAITFQVAPSVAENTYSVFVTIDGKKYKAGRLVVGNPSTEEVIFGAYNFTATTIKKYDDKTVLSGNVVLNDYLYFDGDVTLVGNIDMDSAVSLETGKPAYVHHDTQSYSAFDKILLSNKTRTKAFDNISVKIYDDGQHYNNYEAYKVEAPWSSKVGVIDLGIISVEDNMIYVYPDRVEISSLAGVLKDNTITDLLTNGVEFFQIPDGMPYLKGEVESKSRLMKEGPFAYFNLDMEAGVEGKKLSIAKMLSIEGKISAKVMYDTYNREFELGLTLSEEGPSEVIGSSTEIKNKGDAGITVSVKGEGDNRRTSDKFFNIEVALPLEVTFNVYGVPVTVTDLKASLENYNITKAINNLTSGQGFGTGIKQYLTNKEGADLKVSGAVELVSTNALPKKVSDKIEKWLGADVSLVSADDVYGSVGINYPHIGAGATVNLLGCVELAKIDMELGAISYPNYVTEILNNNDGKKHYGFTFLSSKGVKFDWDAVGANVTGNMAGTVMVDQFHVSSYVSGVVGAKMKVNLFGTSFQLDGEAKTEACAAVWVDKNSDWNVSATIVASVDGTTSLTIFGFDILEEEIHEKYYILNEDKTFN